MSFFIWRELVVDVTLKMYCQMRDSQDWLIDVYQMMFQSAFSLENKSCLLGLLVIHVTDYHKIMNILKTADVFLLIIFLR